MPHSRRHFVANQLYTVTFRVRRGLPLVATNYIKLLLGGIMARALRDDKITLCHHLWMANHPHFLAICHDAQMLVDFYAEVQKKVTDAVKSLLGVSHLALWQGRPIVARVTDLDAAINQVVYLYANPTRANLVDTIEQYPGLNSFLSFKNCALHSEVSTPVVSSEYWVSHVQIPCLPEHSMRLHKDLDFTEELKKKGIKCELKTFPNAWMKCFGIESKAEVAETNQRILGRLKEREQMHRETRILEKKTVIGERELRVQSILKDHIPPQCQRRAFVISSNKKERIAYIEEFKAICKKCVQCFKDALMGLCCEWPPGVFRPSLRHVASALA